jgi:hypothetical protein
MILRVNEIYRGEASRQFQLIVTAAEERIDNWHAFRPLAILGLALAEQKDPNLVLTAKMNFLGLDKANGLSEAMQARLINRCGGLPEVQRQLCSSNIGWTMKVLFINRTAKDYLVRPKTRVSFRGRTISMSQMSQATALLSSSSPISYR